MKKICFIMTDAISFNILCRSQLEYFNSYDDFEITLICGGNPEQIELLRNRKVGKVIFIPFKRKPDLINDIFTLFYLWGFLVTNRFNLVIYSTPKALLLGSIAAFLSFQRRRIAIVQGRVYENYRGLKKNIFQNLDKLCFFFSNKVLFVSTSLMKITLDEGLTTFSKSQVVGLGSFNGTDTVLFKVISLEEKLRLRKKLKLPENNFIVCVVGRICVDKGIEDVKELFEIIRNKRIKLLFVGTFEDENSKHIVDNLVQNNRAIYIPYTSVIHQVFQCADLHLFLSHREGFGNVAIEAASCGIPTFAYDVVGVKDSVSNNISGQRFQFRDTLSIAQAIDQASTNIHFKEKYSSARNWVIENFDQKKVWQNYLDFYLKNLS